MGDSLGVPKVLFGYAGRANATVRNAAEVVRFGGLQTDEEPSPFTVEAEQLTYRLRHYFAADVPADGPPILLVPPLMLTTEIWDVSPRTSAVANLHDLGLDTWVVDFGRPADEPGGLQRTLTDHVLAVSDAIDRVVAATGRDVMVSGYSQGGMFVYQVAALRHGNGIDSLVTFGAPVDIRAPLFLPLSPDVVVRLAQGLLDSGLLHLVNVPGWMSSLGFKLLTPAKSVRDRIAFLLALHDRDALLPRERQRRFLDREGWTAWSGPAIAELFENFVVHNRMMAGGFDIDDRLVTLADIELPVLTVVGSTDTIGHPDSVRAIRWAAPRAQVYELTLRAGHFGLVVGSTAIEHTWPAVANWARWRFGDEPLGEQIVPAEQVQAATLRHGAGAHAVAQATEVGVGAGRIVLGAARQGVGIARGLLSAAPAQLPRLARIEQLTPSTRISLGLLLDEQAARSPDAICFVFGDRAHRQHDVKQRVDRVVSGLVSVGVRHGDRVGVLMCTRPSAFTVVAALSRLGATAVLLRPDGELAREVGLGRVTRIVCDPEHAADARLVDGVDWCVLGGGGAQRELPAELIDMERIDTEQMEPPAWYRPNPHRAADIAFVVFTGDGGTTRAVEITNRRWALSALGTASAAALGPGDTVYSVTPIHHSSALLMSVGGAVAGGARFAMSSGADVDTFWDEVRRYGATHVAYTWTSLHDVVLAGPHPSEQHHPIRMFIGSGMPRNLWKRVSERFPTSRVLEFYASAAGEAILANVSGARPGSMGRPLPGTAEVRVVAFDQATRQLRLGADGLARECVADEVGLLLARVNPAEPVSDAALRGLFAVDDAWESTGDLFLRDYQGELWLAGSVAEIVSTVDGPVLPAAARFCLGSIPAVDLMVAYGIADGEHEVLVGAVTLRAGASLATADLDRAFDRVPARVRPRYVQVVASIPVTTWHRPLWRPLQAAGVPSPDPERAAWRLDGAGAHYQPLTASIGT